MQGPFLFVEPTPAPRYARERGMTDSGPADDLGRCETASSRAFGSRVMIGNSRPGPTSTGSETSSSALSADAAQMPVPPLKDQRQTAAALAALDERGSVERLSLRRKRDMKTAFMSVLVAGEAWSKPDDEAA